MRRGEEVEHKTNSQKQWSGHGFDSWVLSGSRLSHFEWRTWTWVSLPPPTGSSSITAAQTAAVTSQVNLTNFMIYTLHQTKCPNWLLARGGGGGVTASWLRRSEESVDGSEFSAGPRERGPNVHMKKNQWFMGQRRQTGGDGRRMDEDRLTDGSCRTH